MNLVVIHVETTGDYTGHSVAENNVLYVGAKRLCEDSGRLLSAFDTYVKPEWQGLIPLRKFRHEMFKDLTGFSYFTDEDFDGLPTVAEALMELSSFVGNATIISQYCPMKDMPVIREKCARNRLPVRHVRMIDLLDMSRILLPGKADVSLGGLALHFGIVRDKASPPCAGSYLQILWEVSKSMWALLPPGEELSEVLCGYGVLPVIEPY